jgi:hypothetical protein
MAIAAPKVANLTVMKDPRVVSHLFSAQGDLLSAEEAHTASIAD